MSNPWAIPNTFTEGQTNPSTEVQENFSDIQTMLNAGLTGANVDTDAQVNVAELAAATSMKMPIVAALDDTPLLATLAAGKRFEILNSDSDIVLLIDTDLTMEMT